MGKFDEKRKGRKERQHGYKIPSAEAHLIVTEGTETEPLYFQTFSSVITNSIGGNIDTARIPSFKIEGKGRSTTQLLNEVEKIVSKSKVMYKYVWVLFDKDQFDDFDEAIEQGQQKGYLVAWSNYCFEYWLLLHFNYSDSAQDATSLQNSLETIYKRNKIANGKYDKNDPNVFKNVGGVEGVKKAIKNAKKRMEDFEKSMNPSEFDPGTKVYELAEKLLSYIEE